MTDVKLVLEWLDSLCGVALAEARGGNTALVNQLGNNSAVRYYFNNVYTTKTVSREQFAAYYPSQWKEAERLYEEYMRDEQINQSVDRVDALEARFDKLEGMIAQLLENKPAAAIENETAAEVEPEAEEEEEEAAPVAKAKKSKKDEPEAEGDAPETEA